MFKPLAWTKTLAVGFSSILAITWFRCLMVMFIKGRLRPNQKSYFPDDPGLVSAGAPALLKIPKTTLC